MYVLLQLALPFSIVRSWRVLDGAEHLDDVRQERDLAARLLGLGGAPTTRDRRRIASG